MPFLSGTGHALPCAVHPDTFGPHVTATAPQARPRWWVPFCFPLLGLHPSPHSLHTGNATPVFTNSLRSTLTHIPVPHRPGHAGGSSDRTAGRAAHRVGVRRGAGAVLCGHGGRNAAVAGGAGAMRLSWLAVAAVQ